MPILNVHDLLKSAALHARAAAPTVPDTGGGTAAKHVLLAEDSITARHDPERDSRIRGLSGGRPLPTAWTAWTALNAEPFDLLVSDVEMPRIDRVRADPMDPRRHRRLMRGLPVVLVTALESQEDRARGVDVGANAYLIKSNLDQSNLLEALRRLA